MAYINEQELNELRSNANIVDIISDYIPLTPKGKNFFGVCPFHQDHSPSMSVSSEKQMFKCFSCGAAGNVFTFVERYENVSFNEAIIIVASKVGYSLSNTTIKQKKINFPREYEMMNIAMKFYQNNLNSADGNITKEYLKTRKISESNIKEFEIGMALNNNLLNKLLVKKNYKIDELRKIGLISDNTKVYDIFFNRVMFPIHDIDGRVVGFTGRAFDNNNTPKYLGSRESNIYKKSKILYNYHRAKEFVKINKNLIIVEGNMDAVRLYISGVKNVVALMGTALTKEQIEIIKKLRCCVTLILDNDSAGEKATYDNGLLLEKNGIKTNVVRLSGEKDPDDYVIKNGIDAINKNIDKAITFNEFKLLYLKKDKNLEKTEDLINYVKEVLDNLKNTDDELAKEITLQKISEEYNISYETLKKQIIDENKVINNIEIKKPEIKKQNNYVEAINNILYYMMNDSDYIKIYLKKLGFINEKKYRLIATEIICFYEMHNNINIADFVTFANNSASKDEIMNIISSITNEELNEKVFIDSINLVKRKNTEEEIAELKLKIKNTLDENEKEKLANKLLELKVGCVGNERN